LVLFQFAFSVFVLAQTSDTLPATHPDSTRHQTKKLAIDLLTKNDSVISDSFATQILRDTAWISIAVSYKNFADKVFAQNNFFGFLSSPVIVRSYKKEFHGKELLFYTLIGLLLFFCFYPDEFPQISFRSFSGGF